MNILSATQNDLEQILKLQYLAYQSEAKLHNNNKIQPLVQTLEELEKEYQDGILLKGIDENGKIIGSVRGYTEGDTLYIGKLMVDPEEQGKGYGKQLLSAIEAECSGNRYELFTSSKSIRNLGLYESQGYVRFKENKITPELTIIYLEKNSK